MSVGCDLLSAPHTKQFVVLVWMVQELQRTLEQERKQHELDVRIANAKSYKKGLDDGVRLGASNERRRQKQLQNPPVYKLLGEHEKTLREQRRSSTSNPASKKSIKGMNIIDSAPFRKLWEYGKKRGDYVGMAENQSIVFGDKRDFESIGDSVDARKQAMNEEILRHSGMSTWDVDQIIYGYGVAT